jgi:hypothetical protein
MNLQHNNKKFQMLTRLFWKGGGGGRISKSICEKFQKIKKEK